MACSAIASPIAPVDKNHACRVPANLSVRAADVLPHALAVAFVRYGGGRSPAVSLKRHADLRVPRGRGRYPARLREYADLGRRILQAVGLGRGMPVDVWLRTRDGPLRRRGRGRARVRLERGILVVRAVARVRPRLGDALRRRRGEAAEPRPGRRRRGRARVPRGRGLFVVRNFPVVRRRALRRAEARAAAEELRLAPILDQLAHLAAVLGRGRRRLLRRPRLLLRRPRLPPPAAAAAPQVRRGARRGRGADALAGRHGRRGRRVERPLAGRARARGARGLRPRRAGASRHPRSPRHRRRDRARRNRRRLISE